MAGGTGLRELGSQEGKREKGSLDCIKEFMIQQGVSSQRFCQVGLLRNVMKIHTSKKGTSMVDIASRKLNVFRSCDNTINYWDILDTLVTPDDSAM